MPFDSTHSFDGIEWLNRAFVFAGVDFHDPRLQPIFTFALIWNLFEKTACKRFATLSSIEKSVKDASMAGALHAEDYLPYVEYFRRRYLQDHSIQNLANQLKLRDEKSRELMKEVFVHNTRDLEKIVHALLLIAYRIRNNLFHGEKELHFLYQQEELFRVINNLLTDYLTDIKNA